MTGDLAVRLAAMNGNCTGCNQRERPIYYLGARRLCCTCIAKTVAIGHHVEFRARERHLAPMATRTEAEAALDAASAPRTEEKEGLTDALPR